MNKQQLQKVYDSIREPHPITYKNLKPRGYRNTCSSEVVYMPTNTNDTTIIQNSQLIQEEEKDDENQPLLNSLKKMEINKQVN